MRQGYSLPTEMKRDPHKGPGPERGGRPSHVHTLGLPPESQASMTVSFSYLPGQACGGGQQAFTKLEGTKKQ